MEQKRITPRTLSGFRDFLPKEALAKENLLHTLIPVFRSFGFLPIETPHLEYADILVKQGSDEIQKELYRFVDHGGREVALRFDQTVPLARYISMHKQAVGLPFKRYVIGNVFRGERAQKGRYREFTQCDFDFIGSDSISSDAEVAQLIYASLHALGVGDFEIVVNHRKILNGIAEMVGIEESLHAVLRIVDKLDKIGLDGVKQELSKELSLDERVIERLLELISLEAKGDDVLAFLDSLQAYTQRSESFAVGVAELREFFEILYALPLERKNFKVSFSVARGLGYYTGIVYETFLMDLPTMGSVCSGGRYDHLTQSFSAERMSGVGASIGIDRLLAALNELGREVTASVKKILVIAMDESCLIHATKVAFYLRRNHACVELYPDIVKLKKSLQYANTRGYEEVAIIGSEEVSKGVVTLKDMQSGNQRQVSLDSLMAIECNI